MEKWLIGAAVVLAAGLLSWRSLQPYLPLAGASGGSASRVAPTPSPLVNDPRAGVLYKLSPKDQNLLIQTVEHFCVKTYHRDSCIHHLITCGNPCLVAIPKAKRKRIFAEYEALRKARGLPSLPRTPHGNEQ